MSQFELFGPCIMGRRAKSEAERLVDCERRAEALGMSIIALVKGDPRWDDLEINCEAGPYVFDDGYYIWPLGGLDCALLEEELAWFESQEREGDPEPDPRPRKALPRRATA